MELIRISICNFRSFGSRQVISLDNETLFIGKNSTGKTALLAAISKMFSSNPSQRILRRSDFHIDRDEDPNNILEKSLQIETVFSFGELESQEDLFAGSSFFSGAFLDPESGKLMLRVRLDASWTRSANPEGSIESTIRFVTCPLNKEPENNDFIKANRSELDAIRLIYIPATRDPDEQLKGASSGLMQTILSSYKWNETDKERLQNSVDAINQEILKLEGIGFLSKEVGDSWKRYDSDSRYNNAILEFYASDLEKALRRPGLTFLPSVTERPFGTDEIGDGLRSLLYFSLVESMLNLEDEMHKMQLSGKSRCFDHEPPVFTIIAVEEPENHISPHLLGKLMTSLNRLVERGYAQVLVTSHSPSIAQRVAPESIRHLILDETSLETLCRPILLPDKKDEAFKYIKGAVRSYPELYFADLVILGEGASEEIVIPKILAASGIGLDEAGISVVPLGGRHVNHLWKLLYDLEIPCITLLDLDWGRDSGGWKQITYVIEQLIENGISASEFHQVDGAELTPKIIQEMKEYSSTHQDELEWWINQLEKYNVFFSFPLDIDLMMLEAYSKYYKNIAESGPRINGVGKISHIEIKDPENDAYLSRVSDSLQDVLHKNGNDGGLYSDCERKLMVWYKYLFLDNGKPVTHVLALESVSEEELNSDAPAVLVRLVECAKKMMVTQIA